MKKLFGLILSLLFLQTSCTFFNAPEGIVELRETSVHTRTERPTASEEIVYCSADVKITNTGDKTIYNCTITAVATSDKGIEHYISLNYDVNIPPSQSLYVTVEWSLVRQIDTSTETSTSGHSSGSETSSSSSSTSTTTTKTTVISTNEETGWNKSSIKILDYYFD
ncbi:MAG: hypothetical protein ILP07_00715 [Treponema sp.]|nr:hypothetical protein [Treponema sp.]MBR6296183.1 hypothetical protein [Treponema sp.]